MIREPLADGTPLVGNDRYEGYIADLASKICYLLDLDCAIRIVKDGRYGAINPDRTWNGMIGELTRAVISSIPDQFLESIVML